ncbi:MAG: PA14 domain-containing protein [Chthonomonadaceae bacterium]|nr:PA14 domain-containing protein [Chthonomonadaceae bacterium]
MSAHVVFERLLRSERTARKLTSYVAVAALMVLGSIAAPVLAQNGLRGDYFHGMNFQTFVTSRLDATVDFDWGNGSPIPGTVNPDQFSIRWTGFVETTVSGEYLFEVVVDDGVRLWVNDQQIIDSWRDQAPTTYQGRIQLAGGTRYTIRMEFYENGGGAVARLRWRPPGAGSIVPIPSSNLRPPEAPVVAVPVVDPSNALVTGSIEVSMSTSTPNAQIYYTIDTTFPLTTPTTSSSLYTGPFFITVNAPTYITARAFKDGMLDSARTVVFSPGALNYPSGFTDVDNVILNGHSTRVGNVIRLTGDLWDRCSSFFSKGTVDITAFSTSFTFTQTPGDTGAEGMMFVIQGVGANALGNGGNGMGFAGIGRSLGVKFDIYQNPSTADPSNSSTGLFLNGANPFGGINLLPGINLRSGQVMRADVTYDGTVLRVTLTNTATGATSTQNYTVNIPAIVGGNRAFLGFTGSTNSFFTAVQDVRTWTYTPLSAIVSGTITLEGASAANVPLTFEFRPTDGSSNFTRTITPAANGGFSVSVPRKNYIVSIKGSKWLRKNVPINASTGNSGGHNITLLGGDANDDNVVDLLDLALLIQASDTCQGDTGFLANADLNNDDCVDVVDLALIVQNFDLAGDD